MPIEHELKYVLDRSFIGTKLPPVVYEQYYLDDGIRIRRRYGQGTVFTYKRKLPDNSVLEIETLIEPADAEKLIGIAVKKLVKWRWSQSVYSPDYRKKWTWDADLFMTPKEGVTNPNPLFGPDWETYFAMAECELYDGHKEPDEIPIWIAERILYKVPENESSLYTSHKLCDPSYATKLMHILSIKDDVAKVANIG